MRTRPLILTAIAVLAASVLVGPAQATSEPRSAPAGKQPVAVGTGGAVTSADLDASRAGIAVLRHGGNAIDAAVATASALGVTEPFVAGPGGGGFMVIYLAKQHRVVTIDGREKCPARCTSTMFQDSVGQRRWTSSTLGARACRSGVPGMVATWANAVRHYGRHSFASDLQPRDRRSPSRGFAVDNNFHQQEQASLADLQSFTSSRKLFLTSPVSPLPVGTALRNPDLAQHLFAAGRARTAVPVRRPARRRHREHRAAPAGARATATSRSSRAS